MNDSSRTVESSSPKSRVRVKSESPSLQQNVTRVDSSPSFDSDSPISDTVRSISLLDERFCYINNAVLVRNCRAFEKFVCDRMFIFLHFDLSILNIHYFFFSVRRENQNMHTFTFKLLMN